MTNRRCFVQLGRVGDILNVLPLAKLYRDESGITPLFMVAAEFASILEGVNYVQPFLYFGSWTSPLLAMFEARKVTTDIVLCQIHGHGLNNPRMATSFARESWYSAGATVPWGSLPLEINNRDLKREMALHDLHLSQLGDRRLVLFAGRGNSSPFPYAKPLLEFLRAQLGERFLVLDLGDVMAERFYDLLWFFDRAACLVAIDTAHQHLAAACPKLPVIALCTRDPSSWHGSPWRKEHVARFFYDEFPAANDQLLAAVTRAVTGAWHRRIVHVWADWRTERSVESARRASVAQASWEIEYATGRWSPCQVLKTEGARDGTGIGDPHNVNYVFDTVEAALKVATHPKDIVALTNADIGFFPGLTGKILETVTRYGAAYTHRRDFDHIEAPFLDEADAPKGKFYPGTDAFFFTVEWWEKHHKEYGDFLMGREHWDEVLRQLVKYHGGREIEGAVWHEWHESFWSGAGREIMPGNLHNLKLKEEWFAKTGLQPEDYRWWQTSKEQVAHPQPFQTA